MGQVNLRGVRPAELRDLYRTLISQGAELSVNRRSHMRVVLPNGRTLTGALSSSDRRSVHAFRTSLRLHGWDVANGRPLSHPDGRV